MEINRYNWKNWCRTQRYTLPYSTHNIKGKFKSYHGCQWPAASFRLLVGPSDHLIQVIFLSLVCYAVRAIVVWLIVPVMAIVLWVPITYVFFVVNSAVLVFLRASIVQRVFYFSAYTDPTLQFTLELNVDAHSMCWYSRFCFALLILLKFTILKMQKMLLRRYFSYCQTSRAVLYEGGLLQITYTTYLLQRWCFGWQLVSSAAENFTFGLGNSNLMKFPLLILFFFCFLL